MHTKSLQLTAAAATLMIFLSASASLSAPQKDTTPGKLQATAAVTESAVPLVQWKDSTVKPTMVLLCIHGLGLHKGTYEAFGKEMAKAGVATYALDVRGFGEWTKENGKPRVDFDSAMNDIKSVLMNIHKNEPGLPVVILGESMGGAMALRAAALYPDLVCGLISSVPAGDRFGEASEDIAVGFHILVGLGKPFNIGKSVVRRATNKTELQAQWQNDPLSRTKLSPGELMKFQKFMNKNYEMAGEIKTLPVLFIQGTKDKLVRPAGTWQLCNRLATPNKQVVFSKTGEHLIFEEAQFSPEDLSFVRSWLSKNVAVLSDIALSNHQPAVVASSLDKKSEQDSSTTGSDASGQTDHLGNTSTAQDSSTRFQEQSLQALSAKPAEPVAEAVLSASNTMPSRVMDSGTSSNARTDSSSTTPLAQQQNKQSRTTQSPSQDRVGINYWIELYRHGKIYRCNNKMSFHSGDAIRFHVVPQSDGFAYVVMKEGSSGKSSMLFPTAKTGTSNYLKAGKDYPLPNQSWLKFDEHPGIEHVNLVFSRMKIDLAPHQNQPAYFDRLYFA